MRSLCTVTKSSLPQPCSLETENPSVAMKHQHSQIQKINKQNTGIPQRQHRPPRISELAYRGGGEGNGNALQYPCLGNPMDGGAWRTMVHEVAKESDTTQQLNKIEGWNLNNLCFFNSLYDSNAQPSMKSLTL